MKKGFTLVEIIISIVLILITGISVTLFVMKSTKDNEIEKITKEILDASSAFIKIEKDNNGNVYADEIVKGAKGIKVQVSNLVNTGYLNKSIVNRLYDIKGSLEDNQDYYILFVQEDSDYCTENEITSYVSWIPKGESIYLCDEYTGNPPKNKKLIETILENYSDEIPIKDTITEDDYYIYENNADLNISDAYGFNRIYFSKQTGLYKKTNGTYYYRGEVGDNYVNIFGEIFRIISFDNNKIRLIREKAIYENYFLDYYNGTIDSDYNNSPLKDAVISYYGDLTMDCYSYDMVEKCEETFTQGEFCDEQKVHKYGFGKFQLSSSCSKTPLNLYVGLITVDEAIYAGVPLLYFSNCNGFYHPFGCTDAISVGNSWLSSGDTTIMLNTTKNEAQGSIYGNEYYSVLSNDLYTGGHNVGTITGFLTQLSTQSTNINKIPKIIRPVVIIENNYTKVKGKGTIDNPYELIFE